MKTLIANALVFDGTGSSLRRQDVLIEQNRITRVADAIEPEAGEMVSVIDGSGATLMPGMIDGHTHLGLGSTVEHLSPRTEPEEEQALIVSHNARVMLDHGYTSIYSGGNRRPRVEIALRKAINEGWMPGPRMRAASWEVSADTMKAPSANIGSAHVVHHVAAHERDPITDQVRTFVHDMADLGVDIVKMPISGESALVEYTSRLLEFKEEEIAAAGEAARERGIWLTAHAHSPEAIQLAIRHGFRVIYHATYMDDETIAACAAAKDRIFIAPSPGSFWITTKMGSAPPPGMETEEGKASLLTVVPKLIEAGVRLVVGSDYGFGISPIGTNANDLHLFVDWFGMTPAAVLRCATEVGGQLMGMESELGLVREGYLADLLLVEGDPTADITIMQDRARLSMIMKDGRLHKLTSNRASRDVVQAIAA